MGVRHSCACTGAEGSMGSLGSRASLLLAVTLERLFDTCLLTIPWGDRVLYSCFYTKKLKCVLKLCCVLRYLPPTMDLQ
jgi:hypothetical protein